MFTRTALFLTAVAMAFAHFAFATPSIQSAFIAKYPDLEKTQLNTCATCHMPAKEGFLNAYAVDLKKAGLNFEAIEAKDSDGDGKTNLEELKALTFPGSQADELEIFVFKSKMAPVRFNHGAHVIDPGHTINGNCTVCHGDDGKPFAKFFDAGLLIKDQAHSTCLGCHQKSGAAGAPTKCLDCHKKQ